jgi:hypothetical protein
VSENQTNVLVATCVTTCGCVCATIGVNIGYYVTNDSASVTVLTVIFMILGLLAFMGGIVWAMRGDEVSHDPRR